MTNKNKLDAYQTTVRTSWVDKKFHLEAINGDHLCPTYLYRWTLLELLGWKVYLHHFVGNDWAIDPHDHPKDFYSFGFRGSYVERYYHWGNEAFQTRVHKAPFLNFFPAKHIHRVTCNKSCWTIVLVTRWKRDWGFWLHDVQWWRFDHYISRHGENRKDC